MLDDRQPRPELLRSRTTSATRQILEAEAAARGLTLSRLIAELLDAHAANRQPSLPRPRAEAHAALRELARIGNNLNQLARQANLMNLHLVADSALRCIGEINALARRIA